MGISLDDNDDSKHGKRDNDALTHFLIFFTLPKVSHATNKVVESWSSCIADRHNILSTQLH